MKFVAESVKGGVLLYALFWGSVFGIVAFAIFFFVVLPKGLLQLLSILIISFLVFIVGSSASYFYKKSSIEGEFFLNLVESIDEAIYVISKSGRLIWANERACELLGVCHDSMVGVYICDRCPFGMGNSFSNCEIIKKVLLDGYYVKEVTVCGKNIDCLLEAKRLKVESGQIEGVVVLATDISRIKSLQRELERLLKIDHLTGIFNRRVLDEEVSTIFKTALRYKRPLSVILFDIDDFKAVNDFYGHEVGDNTLKELASVVKKRLRSSDIFLRHGGEEFLLVLPETDINGALSLAEDIRRTVEKHDKFPTGRVTCSFGVATLKEGDSLDSLISRADKAMYAAKKSGKNCVKYFL